MGHENKYGDSLNELADTGLNPLGHFSVVGSKKALPGDYAAFPRAAGSGHATIYTGNIGIRYKGVMYRDAAIGAGRDTVNINPVNGPTGLSITINPPVFRRYQ